MKEAKTFVFCSQRKRLNFENVKVRFVPFIISPVSCWESTIRRLLIKRRATEHFHFKCIPLITASDVLRLLKEETAVAANIFNTQLETFNKGWSSNLCVGHGTNNSSRITWRYTRPRLRPFLWQEGWDALCCVQPPHTFFATRTVKCVRVSAAWAAASELWNVRRLGNPASDLISRGWL